MSIRAGSIVTVAGRNVVDRLQSAGLGNAQVPIETIREIGNDLVVDKVPGEPDFTFAMSSWDVSTDMIAFLQGKIGNPAANQPPGYTDADHTEYKWENCQFVNITSPWKRNTGSAGGNIAGGLLIPAYYPTRLRYRLGVTENATQEVELAGGSYYYAATPPVEEVAAGTGSKVAFVTSENARAFRLGGSTGTTWQRVFGVLLDGVLQTKGVDYVESISGADTGAAAATTITFAVAPANLAQVRYVYFTETAKAYAQALNADATVKPGAVRGRDITILLGPDGSQVRFAGVQTFEMDATTEGSVDREMGNPDPTGRDVTGTDVTGTVTFRPKDIPAFFSALNEVTNVLSTEVFGYFNEFTTPCEVQIHNPKNAGEILKTIYIAQGQFQPPGTPARVNAPTDFAMQFNAVNGTFSEFKKGR